MSHVLLLGLFSRAHLANRIVDRRDGEVLLMAEDRRRAYWMTERDLRMLEARIADETRGSRMALRWALWLNFPFVCLVVLFMQGTGLGPLIDSAGPWLAAPTIFACLAGLPLTMLHRHRRAVLGAESSVEWELERRPSIRLPKTAARRGPDWVEWLVLLLVAPNVIASIIRLFDPEALSGTRLAGSTLSFVTLGLLAILLIRRASGHSARRLKS